MSSHLSAGVPQIAHTLNAATLKRVECWNTDGATWQLRYIFSYVRRVSQFDEGGIYNTGLTVLLYSVVHQSRFKRSFSLYKSIFCKRHVGKIWFTGSMILNFSLAPPCRRWARFTWIHLSGHFWSLTWSQVNQSNVLSSQANQKFCSEIFLKPGKWRCPLEPSCLCS